MGALAERLVVGKNTYTVGSRWKSLINQGACVRKLEGDFPYGWLEGLIMGKSFTWAGRVYIRSDGSHLTEMHVADQQGGYDGNRGGVRLNAAEQAALGRLITDLVARRVRPELVRPERGPAPAVPADAIRARYSASRPLRSYE
jgi:hypothetical protein